MGTQYVVVPQLDNWQILVDAESYLRSLSRRGHRETQLTLDKKLINDRIRAI